MMRVLQINAVYGYGSTGLIVKDIADLLEKNGDEAFVAFSQGEKSDKCYKFTNEIDKKKHALLTRIFGKQGYFSKKETKKFLKWVDEVKPDIVQLHNLHGNYINLPMLLTYLAKNNIATVVTMHDCWYFTGKCTHYVKYNCNRFQDCCGKCPQKHKEFESWFFDKSKKVVLDREKYFSLIKNLTIVGCSKWIADECKKSRLKNCNITFIRNGIDTTIFKPTENKFRQEQGLNDEFVILGFANKWREDRNLNVVNSIIENLKDNDRIVLVGCTDEDVKRFSNYKNIVTVGFISDRNELADIYSSCDVFVNLTHADTLPTVNMESVCCGTPVITFNATGSPELVDENSGFVVEEDNSVEMVNKINEIKKNCKIDSAFYMKKFDKQANYNNYIKLYKEILEK